MTAKKDKKDRLISSWAYDDNDRVEYGSTRDGKGVTINYVSENKVEVTDTYGVKRTYEIWDIDGRKKVADISISGCISCNNDIVRIEYDNQARIIEVEYASGRIDQFDDFDDRGNAQTVREAVGTQKTRTITYTFHPDTHAKLTRAETSVPGTGNKVTIWD